MFEIYPISNWNNDRIVFFQRLLGYVIYKWPDFNAQHTNVTLNFLKYDVLFLKSVGHLENSRFRITAIQWHRFSCNPTKSQCIIEIYKRTHNYVKLSCGS